MKFRILILFQFLSLSIFCQYQPLETLDEFLIGPENVNVHFEEQVEFYLEKYNSMILNIDELEVLHQEELERLEGNVKKKLWRRNQIRKVNETIDLLIEDRIAVENYIQKWEEFQFESWSHFNENYDSKQCYNIMSKTKTYLPNEYSIELEDSDSISWEVFVPKNMVAKIKVTRISQSSGHKWVKKRADKNCLSNDPDDCMIWCLVEIPEEFRTFNYYEGFPKVFKYSEEKEGYIILHTLERINNNQYRLFDLRENIEIKLVNYQVVDCN